MDEIKVSQLDAVDEVRDTDVIMEISGGANKKATIQQLKENIVKDEYGTADDSSYSQKYQNEHNVVVSPTQPTTSERVWFKQGKNLFNKNTALRKTGINSSGNLVQNNNYFTSELIKVNSNTDYYVVGAAVVYGYSNSGSYIGMLKETLSAGTFNTGEASYIRLRNWWATDDTQMEEQINATMLNIGTTGLPYEDYIIPSIIVNDTEFYSQEYINGKTLGTSLYSNASGTHEAFTLSEDIKHFREIEVTFGRSSWTNMKQKVRVVPQQSGTTPIGLIALYPTTDGNSLVLASAVFEIGSSGTNAQFPRNTSGTIGSTGFVKDTATYVNVYEVVGYK